MKSEDREEGKRKQKYTKVMKAINEHTGIVMRVLLMTVILTMLCLFSVPSMSAVQVSENVKFQTPGTNTTFIMGSNFTFDTIEIHSTYLTLGNAIISVCPSVGSTDFTLFNFSVEYKKWNESCSNPAATTNHTIGGLKTNIPYLVKVNGAIYGHYTSNESGYVFFTYSGGYSETVFEMEEADATLTAVNISPTTQTVLSNEPFTVNVTVNPAVPIAGAQFDLSFNSSLVTANSVAEGNLLKQGGANTYFSPGTIDNTSGTITGVAGAITTLGETVSSPGVFATIQMTAKSAEGTSTLDISNVIVGDVNGNPVSITVNDGSVTVTPYPDWDVNYDGHVNVLDMIRVGQHWGETGAAHWIREDVNRDGSVNVLDMILIGQHWTG